MLMLPTRIARWSAALLAALLLSSIPIHAQEANETSSEAEQQKRFEQFEKLLTGAKLVGRFTIIGREQPPADEEYTILSVTKGEEPDNWFFNARIKYGDKDATVPMLLKVKWAGDTPVITLTDFAIPGFGTFSARVVFYNNKYAGTWSHGDVGGHLFGVVQRADAE